MSDLGRWEPLTPEGVSQLLSPLQVPWWIAGGWALDLFLGHQTREHRDVDGAVLRDHQADVRGLLGGWDPHTAVDGVLEPWVGGQWIDEPVHGVWVRRAAGEPWVFELLFEERHDNEWQYRRDRQITMPLAEVGHMTDDGIPYLRPEITLLYRAGDPTPEAQADLEAVLPKLGIGPRCWLAGALDVAHPGHTWMELLL